MTTLDEIIYHQNDTIRALPIGSYPGELGLVWRDGKFIRRENYATIRARARAGLR